MPKNGTRAEVNTFVKGLISEASPLNFPANASFDEVNFELHRDGTRSRRLGMDMETNSLFQTSSIIEASAGSAGYGSFIWKAVNGDPTVEFVIIQAGNQLAVYNNTSESLSSSGLITVLSLTFSQMVQYAITSVDGKLVIAAGESTIAVVTYNPSISSFTIDYTELMVRDFWGVEELDSTLENDATRRPADLSATHVYNLLNQSWGISRKDKVGTVVDPITLYHTDLTVYPSSSEEVWAGLQFQPIVGAAVPFERMFTNLYEDRLGASSIVSRGYFIINFLSRGASRKQAVLENNTKYPVFAYNPASLPTDSTSGGATVLTEFAGRVFFGGFQGSSEGTDKRSPSVSNYILFSSLVRNISDINKCYQEGDPTSRENSDILDTDGGYLRVAGARQITGLVNLGTDLIVLATNGVWSITGGNNYGFSASNYKVSKISSYGCISPTSAVVAGAQLLFWSEEGIFNVGKNQYGDATATSVTEATIQSIYETIPYESRASCRGLYDLSEKKIRWLYKLGVPFSSTSLTRELTLDTTIGAFSIQEIPSLNTTFEIILGFTYAPSLNTRLKYLVAKKTGLTYSQFGFSEYRDITFRDWKSVDSVGVDAKAYLLTGAVTANDSAISKQIPYLTAHFFDTEEGTGSDGVILNPSGCLARIQWDWATEAKSKRWSKTVQLYRKRKTLFTTPSDVSFSSGLQVVVSKTKMRGRGKAFSLYLESEPYKDCKVIGWSITLNGNAIT